MTKPSPILTTFTPGSGEVAGGTLVTITGTNLTGATAVMFGTVAASGFSVVSSTQITATTPAHVLGNVVVSVTTPGGSATCSVNYTYVHVNGGVVTTLAGSGSPGSTNGTGTAASFQSPFGVAVDSSGNVYVADYNNMIREIS